MSNTRKKTLRQVMDEMPTHIRAKTQGISYYINHGFFNNFDYDENTKIENSDTLVFFKSEIIDNQRSTQYWEYDPHSKTLEPFSFKNADQELTSKVGKKASYSASRKPSSLAGTKTSYPVGTKTSSLVSTQTSFSGNAEASSLMNMKHSTSENAETNLSKNMKPFTSESTETFSSTVSLSSNKGRSFSWSIFSKIAAYGLVGIVCGLVLALVVGLSITLLGLSISPLSPLILIPLLVATGAWIGVYTGVKKNCNSTPPLDSNSSLDSIQAEIKQTNTAGSTLHVASKIEGVKKLTSENPSQPDLKGFSVSKTEQKNHTQGVSRNLDPSTFQQTKTIKNR